MSKSALDAIRTQVMWNRLIAVVEEQAQSLLRTAFGTITREAGDLSAGVYDADGHMIAQAMTGTPGHVNTMATAVGHFFKHYPQSTMKPGDVYVTNDPWLGTGHLFDYVMMTPVFLGKKLVAFFASTCHVIDVGGVGMSAKANSSYEEGTLIPHLKMRKEGKINEELLAVILANSRNPVEVRGDLLSLVSANDTGARRLIEMMTEFKLTSLEPLAKHILTTSEKGAREAIKSMPEGEWSYEMPLDGYEGPITIKSKLTIRNGKITIDFTGTSAASIFGINSPRTYTHAYSVFGLKAVIAPHVPNNIGSLSCFDLVTEPGTCVDPIRPSPVTARHVIGQMLADAVFGCLAQALPGKVQAESAGSIWILGLNSAHGRVPAHETAKGQGVRRDQHCARRHRRQARQGWPGHHRLSLRHRRHPHRSHRKPVPALFQAQGIPDRTAPAPANGAAAFRRRLKSPTARKPPSRFPPQPSTASKIRRRGAMAAAPA